MTRQQRTAWLVSCGLVVLAVGTRWLFWKTAFAPNVEFVTMATLLAAYYFGRRFTFLVPLTIMFVSDLLIGNTMIFLFTWSAFLLAGLAGALLRRRSNEKTIVGATTLTGLGFALFFFLWTNFGVWVLGDLYPQTWAGLMQSYVMAIPFLKLHLVSTLVFVPVGFTIAEAIRQRLGVRQPQATRIINE